MEFRILGPLEVRADGRAVALGGAKPRAVLAMLLTHANQPVSGERLALALWGEDAPAGAVKTVQVHVSRLRKALGDPDLLVTTPAGYRLRVGRGQLDVERFERHVTAGRQALAAGRAERAAVQLREALALWRGAPLAEFAWAPFAPAEISQLEELQLAALELRVEADLAAGRHAELVPELQRLTSQHSWRERLHAQLMLALYRSGRQADALEAYRQAREVLVEQLGIEPGVELHDLQQAILAHDPGLAAPDGTATAHVEGRSALPVAPNRLIGRVDELRALAERLRAGSVQLLTLTGPGGVGKTRLALGVARAVETDFLDGAHLVSLAAVQRPQNVAAAIVKSLEIVPLAGESAEQAVERFVGAKHLLLVLDNFEHVLDAAPILAELLAACPGVTVLATSREPLSLSAEHSYPLSPLAFPGPEMRADPAALARVDAVELFTERARAHDPEFALGVSNAAAIAEICRRVDGLPLAVELAAARCRLLSPTEIAERLDAALGALGPGPRDAPARQRTLRATIEWSYDLLGVEEKASFTRFAVFAGGATVQAVENITGASLATLDQLVAKSLLVAREHPQEPTRLEMLSTIDAYATERLATAADHDTVHERHYRYFRELAERHGSDGALWGIRRHAHLARLDADIDNLHSALEWAIRDAGEEEALGLCTALGSYWLTRARYSDAVAWTDRVLELPGAMAHPRPRIRALTIKSWGLWPLGRGAEQTAVLAEAEGEARTLADPLILSQVLQMRATQEAVGRRQAAAEPLADEAAGWAVRARDDWAIASAAYSRAIAAQTGADLRDRVDRAADLLDDVGNVYQLAELLASAAYVALRRAGEHDARAFASRAAPLARELDSPFLSMLLSGSVGFAAVLTGDVQSARQAFFEQLALCRTHVMLPFVSEGLAGLAAVAVVRDRNDRAARLAGAASAHRGGRPEDPLDLRLQTTFFEPARTRHGPEAWDRAVAFGGAMKLNDAIAFALEEPRERPDFPSPRLRPDQPLR